MSIERRLNKITELRADVEGSDPVLTGYCAKFSVLSEDLGNFREKLSPGCFTRSLRDGNDVTFNFNHSPDHTLARTGNGSLKLEEDGVGLKFRAVLPPTQAAKDLHTLVSRGIVNSCSFAFAARGQSWSDERSENGDLYACRTLSDCDLRDCAVVVSPAYPQTEVQARMFDPEALVEVRSAVAKLVDERDKDAGGHGSNKQGASENAKTPEQHAAAAKFHKGEAVKHRAGAKADRAEANKQEKLGPDKATEYPPNLRDSADDHDRAAVAHDHAESAHQDAADNSDSISATYANKASKEANSQSKFVGRSLDERAKTDQGHGSFNHAKNADSAKDHLNAARKHAAKAQEMHAVGQHGPANAHTLASAAHYEAAGAFTPETPEGDKDKTKAAQELSSRCEGSMRSDDKDAERRDKDAGGHGSFKKGGGVESAEKSTEKADTKDEHLKAAAYHEGLVTHHVDEYDKAAGAGNSKLAAKHEDAADVHGIAASAHEAAASSGKEEDTLRANRVSSMANKYTKELSKMGSKRSDGWDDENRGAAAPPSEEDKAKATAAEYAGTQEAHKAAQAHHSEQESKAKATGNFQSAAAHNIAAAAHGKAVEAIGKATGSDPQKTSVKDHYTNSLAANYASDAANTVSKQVHGENGVRFLETGELRGSEAQTPELNAVDLPNPFDPEAKEEWWDAFAAGYQDAVHNKKLHGQEAIAAGITAANLAVPPKTEVDPEVVGEHKDPTDIPHEVVDTTGKDGVRSQEEIDDEKRDKDAKGHGSEKHGGSKDPNTVKAKGAKTGKEHEAAAKFHRTEQSQGGNEGAGAHGTAADSNEKAASILADKSSNQADKDQATKTANWWSMKAGNATDRDEAGKKYDAQHPTEKAVDHSSEGDKSFQKSASGKAAEGAKTADEHDAAARYHSSQADAANAAGKSDLADAHSQAGMDHEGSADAIRDAESNLDHVQAGDKDEESYAKGEVKDAYASGRVANSSSRDVHSYQRTGKQRSISSEAEQRAENLDPRSKNANGCDCDCDFCVDGNCSECDDPECDDPACEEFRTKVGKPKDAAVSKTDGDDAVEVPENDGTPGEDRDGAKTKTVAGKALRSTDFAFAGDVTDPSTWKLPVHDAKHAERGLARFNQTQGIPAGEKEAVWKKIVGACQKYGVKVAEENSLRAAVSHEVTLAAIRESDEAGIINAMQARVRLLQIELE